MRPKIIRIKTLPDYQLWLRFSDGIEGQVDLSYLAGKGIFEFWNDVQNFEKATLTPWGAVAWSDQIDLCSDALYLKMTGKKPEELFPTLHIELVDA